MKTIEIGDQPYAALEAKAAALGLTVEAWLEQLAGGKKRYSLDQLVAECDPNAPASPEDQAWLDAPATGREAI